MYFREDNNKLDAQKIHSMSKNHYPYDQELNQRSSPGYNAFIIPILFLATIIVLYFLLKMKAYQDAMQRCSGSILPNERLEYVSTTFSKIYWIRFVFMSFPRRKYPITGPICYWDLNPFGSTSFSLGNCAPQTYPNIFKIAPNSVLIIKDE